MRFAAFLAVVLVGSATACQSSLTVVNLVVTSEAPSSLDFYQVRIGDRTALVEPQDVIVLALPDDMAGQQHALEVWGLSASIQLAYGATRTTPVRGETVNESIALVMLSCGTWCTAGSVACDGDGVVTCEQRSDGCMAWSPATACPMDAPFCSNGACDAECADECSTGETACDSAASVRTCGQYDTDSCTDWSAPTGCASGETCSSGACGMAVTCASDGAECDDGNPCTGNDECGSGVCGGEPTCTAPANGQATCTSNGTCGFSCDTGYEPSGTMCVAVAASKLVFVTASGYSGNMGGLAGADAKCQAEATQASKPGVFKAWLSDNTQSAAQRLTHSTVPYALVDGSIVAQNWQDLVSPPYGLAREIALDANGVGRDGFVYTATEPDGSFAGYTCSNWTSTSGIQDGSGGLIGTGADLWTRFGGSPCYQAHPLYCFQQ